MRDWRLAGPGLLLVAALSLWSLGYAVYESLHHSSLTVPAEWAGVDNYAELLGSGRWWSAVGLTFGLAVGIAVLQVAVGCVIASVLHRSRRGRSFLGFVVLVPFVVVSYGSARLWLAAFDEGFLGAWFGLGGQSDAWGLAAVVLSQVWRGSGIVALIIFVGMRRMPLSLLENARAEGATARQRLFGVIVPGLAPALALAFAIGGVIALGVVDPVLAASDTGRDVDVTSTLVFAGFAETGQSGPASAAAVLSLLLFAIVAGLLFALLRWRRVI